MDNDTGSPMRGFSDAQIASEIRPYLEEAYGDIGANDAWLARLAAVIRDELRKPADAVSLVEWAFDDQFRFDEEAEVVLAGEAARAVLVRLVAELAHVVLLDMQTAKTIVQGMERHFQGTQGWDTATVRKPVLSALTGRVSGLPLSQVMSLLGRERCMRRAAVVLRGA